MSESEVKVSESGFCHKNWFSNKVMEFAKEISNKTPTMLKFAKKLTLTPQELTQLDREQLRVGAGMSNEEILGE